MRRRRARPAAIVAALIAIAITTWMQRGAVAPDGSAGNRAPVQTSAPAPATSSTPATIEAAEARNAPPDARQAPTESSPRYDLDRVPQGEREQLRRTLRLIEAGGPFPYPKKDGTTFGNREQRLPQQPRGYYKEYTVPTPGAKNRGARRVVRGKGGETYYTNDHYASFVRLDE